ncbi:MAG: GAF domain-containing protein, partial [Myxococcales bacterium]
MILPLPTPHIIFWGPDLRQLYNEGYSVIMGPRHPRYLGETYRDCWPDTYPVIFPWMERVRKYGETIRVKDEHIPVTRHGFEEEAYFTFSLSPLLGDDGRIEGVLQPVTEVTEEVLAERRAATLRALSGPRPSSDREVAAHAARILVANAKDIPFVMVFHEEPGQARLSLAAHADLDDRPDPDRWWDVAERVLATGASVVVDDVEARLGQAHHGVWGVPTTRALAVPLRRFDADAGTGVAILGVSPRLRFNDKYRQFLESAARQIAVTLTTGRDARARSEMREREQRMRELLEEQLRHSKVLSAELSATNEQLATRMGELARAKENLEQALREGDALSASLRRTNQELDQFAYVASHDLKAPLRGIASLVSWIEEDLGERLTEESREYMQQLHGRVRRLGALIDGILQFARAGRTREGLETVDTTELLGEVAELLAPTPPARVVLGPALPTVSSEKVPLQ